MAEIKLKKKKKSFLKKHSAAITGSDFTDSIRSSREVQPLEDEEVVTACDEAAKVITKIASFDKKTKSILHEVYAEIEDILRSPHFFPEIRDELTAEFGDPARVICEHKRDVYDELCPIVITGETSAGKSTFVNLLLGVELLPQSPLTCTSPICRISNRNHKSIVLTDNDDRQENVLLQGKEPEEMKALLKDYISATKAGEKYKAVDICWPIPCLQQKIMIVDTPGVSPDNDVLARRLFEYLPFALAFIYVINPTNAGGVQSDRLQRILDEQERRKYMGVRSLFDPRRAIFVCNKWDQMHEDEEKVFNHIKEKLRESWTNFDSSKVFRISAREEIQRSKNGQRISDDFKALLQGIDTMVPACLEEKIFRHANWQRYFLERLNFKLAARITNAMRTEDEKRMMAKQVLKRIKKVRENLKSVQERLKLVAQEECKNVSEKLIAHLQLPETRERMFTCFDEELPVGNDMNDIQREIAILIENKIINEVRLWLRQTNNGGLSEFMTQHLRDQCSIIDTDCTEIDEMIIGRKLNSCSLGMTTVHSTKSALNISDISTGSKFAIIASFPLWAPLTAVLGLIVLPFGIGVFFRDKFKNWKTLKEYKSQKSLFVKNVFDKILTDLTGHAIMQNIFSYFLQEINEQIDSFCEKTIPGRITSGATLVRSLERDMRLPIDVQKQCIALDKHFKSVYGRVLYTYMEYFNEIKLKEYHVRKMDLPKSASEVFVKGKWKETVVKRIKWCYENDADCSVLSEIYLLRNIGHANILNYVGITLEAKSSLKTLEIYTEKCDFSLKTAIFERSKQEEAWKNIQHYLCNSLEGLSFLHGHGFIHGNIKPSNILIKDGAAMVSDIGFRRPSLKGSTDDLSTVSDIIYSLNYGRESDIFKFGILLWESWYRRSTLADENRSSLESYEELSEKFLEGWRPEFEGKISTKLKKLIKGCWKKEPVNRPSARILQENLQLVS